MADYLSDSDVGIGSTPPPSATPSTLSDADVGLVKDQGSPDVRGSTPLFDYASQPPIEDQAVSAVTDIWPEIKKGWNAATSSVAANLNPFSDERHAAYAKQQAAPSFASGLGEGIKQVGDTGSGMLSAVAAPAAVPTGIVHSVGGHALSAAEGIPYDTAKDELDTALLGLAPGRGGLTSLKGPAPVPPTPPSGAVTFSAGQDTGDLGMLQQENAARRNSLGSAAKARADEFDAQQKGQLATARDNTGAALDPFNATIAPNPQQAGQYVSQGIQAAKAADKAGVDQAYTTARAMPGEIHADVFDGIGSAIKRELSNPLTGQEPVRVNPKLTPHASEALDYLDEQIGNLRNPDQASQSAALSQTGPGGPSKVVGVNLEGVDQWRRVLSGIKNQAFSSGNASDGRAAQRVMDAFDGVVDRAVNGPQFTGDSNAAQAWNNARALHSQFRSTYFREGTGDAVGAAMQKITGGKFNGPATPNDVIDQIIGGSGVNPTTANRDIALHVRDILGSNSPEWSGIKQGLFSRLIETPGEQTTPMSSLQIKKRINNFLGGDGKEMADAVYTPADKDLIRQYGDMHGKLVTPQAGAQWSNNAPLLRRMVDKLGVVVGLAVGHMSGLPFGIGEGIGALAGNQLAKVGSYLDARQIAKQMPLIGEQMSAYNKALAAYNKTNASVSRTGLNFARANLARALAPLGISDPALAGSGPQGPGDANADESQPDVNGPPAQQKYGGKVEKKNQFAHGGRVNPFAINHSPTAAQKEAGNYAKDHVSVHGLKIAIENAKGSHRHGVGPGGAKWKVKMPAHYGYVKGTVGADKDHVDVYLGPHHRSSRVFIVDQNNADTGDFDEHKAFLGFANKHFATKVYHAAFSDGKGAQRLGGMTEMPIDKFKSWLSSGKTKKPLTARRS